MSKKKKPGNGDNTSNNRKARRAAASKVGAAKSQTAKVIAMPQQRKGIVPLPEIQPGQKRVLHVSVGGRSALHPSFATPEWVEVKLDSKPEAKPDIVANMLDMPMVASGSMDAVWSAHTLECLYGHQVVKALKECVRVLKQDGMIVLVTPDMEAVAEAAAKKGVESSLYTSPSGVVSPLDVMYGSSVALEKGHHDLAHKTAFTARLLARRLLEAGLADIRVDSTRGNYSLTAVGYKRAVRNQNNTKPRYIQPDVNAMMLARDEIDVPPQETYDFDFS